MSRADVAAAPSPPAPAPAATTFEQRAAFGIARVLNGWRLDPMIGLIFPLLGDVACGAAGLLIVGFAARARAPKVVLARMLLNIAFDALLGSIPLVGDLLDFWFPAHTLNARLLARTKRSRRDHLGDWLVLVGAALVCLTALALPLLLLVWLVKTAFHA